MDIRIIIAIIAVLILVTAPAVYVELAKTGGTVAVELGRAGWEATSAVKEAKREDHGALKETVDQQVQLSIQQVREEHPNEVRRVTPMLTLTSMVAGSALAMGLGLGVPFAIRQLF